MCIQHPSHRGIYIVIDDWTGMIHAGKDLKTPVSRSKILFDDVDRLSSREHGIFTKSTGKRLLAQG